MALVAGRYAVTAAFILTGSLLFPYLFGLAICAMAAGAVVFKLLRRPAMDPSRPILVVTILFALSAGRALIAAELSVSVPTVAAEETRGQPPVYWVLVDGYPRADTMEAVGIDLQPFIAALEDRGFEHYPSATSRHAETLETLRAMFGNKELVAPADLAIIDSPVGHVRMTGGKHIGPQAISDLDIDLLGRTAPMVVAPEVIRAFVGDDSAPTSRGRSR